MNFTSDHNYNAWNCPWQRGNNLYWRVAWDSHVMIRPSDRVWTHCCLIISQEKSVPVIIQHLKEWLRYNTRGTKWILILFLFYLLFYSVYFINSPFIISLPNTPLHWYLWFTPGQVKVLIWKLFKLRQRSNGWT